MTIALCDLPADLRAKLPRYPVLPATLVGRLAVDRGYRKRGWGEHLLVDALRRSVENSTVVASMAVVVNAKNTGAQQFHAHYDFVQFPDRSNRLFLPMSKIARLFR
jgi:predicted GNAT family N-acyltransferase